MACAEVRPHSEDEADHALQGGVVAQLEVLLHRNVEGRADGGEGLRLLDSVDAQVGLQVQVQLQHVLGVAGLLGDDAQNRRLDCISPGRGCQRLNRRLPIAHGSCFSTACAEVRPVPAHEANHAAQGGIVAQADALRQRDVEVRADGREGLGLLDRIDAQVGLQVQVQLQHVLWIAGLLGDDTQNRRGHLVSRRCRDRMIGWRGGLLRRRCRQGCRRLNRRLPIARGRSQGARAAGRRLATTHIQVWPVLAHEAYHAAQGGIVAQADSLRQRDVERRADGGKGLGLLDGVDAQVCLQVQIEVQHVFRVPRLLSHQPDDSLHHLVGGRSSRPGCF